MKNKILITLIWLLIILGFIMLLGGQIGVSIGFLFVALIFYGQTDNAKKLEKKIKEEKASKQNAKNNDAVTDMMNSLKNGEFTKFSNIGETVEYPDPSDEEVNEAREISSNIATPKELSRLKQRASYLDFDDPLRIAYNMASYQAYGYYVKFKDDFKSLNTIFYYESPTNNVIQSIGEIITPEAYNSLNEIEKRFFKKITMEDYNYSKGRFKQLIKNAISKNCMAILRLFEIYYSHDEDKESKFNNFIEKNDFLKNGFEATSDFYQEFNTKKEMMIKIQNLQGLPASTAFIKAGYEKLDDIKKLSDDEILSIKGIGAKKLEEIKIFLNNVK
ncbi:helix-hairpin-helix domain-containing protein [Campylobacter sp. RM16187]|uniref:helix-hairpin-helix domain-containing protein n=1 Tax=Campylobacter sp. RM16187 TaxID=1660063 RepID=UPI0021B4DFA0|nr:helix-hairpin-helix domain-containing protein [Campylobacter sp. RM16187]QKG29212.1 hypothetical protein CDOMF_0950 [Campylobacter sp. RM16187]